MIQVGLLGCFLNHLVWFMPIPFQGFISKSDQSWFPSRKKYNSPSKKWEEHCRVVGAIFPIFQPQAPWTFKTKRTIWLIFTYMNEYHIYIYTYKLLISSSFPRVSVVFVPPFLRRAALSTWRGRSWPAASSASSRRSRCWRGCRWPRAASGALP